ncbi:MAG: PfkB family carbohydrate kinase, partial [Pseudomonadota bacterium]
LAPAQPIELDALKRIDFLIVNAGELSMLMSLLGRPAASQVDEMLVTAGRFTGGSVIVTLGPDGAQSYHQGEISSTPSPTIDVVDTVGAGDAFVGVFAAAIEQKLSFDDAVQRGCVAGALACQKIGAQSSLPDAAAIEAML